MQISVSVYAESHVIYQLLLRETSVSALNGLQLAVQACVNKTLNANVHETHTPQNIVVQEKHVKEGLQRSHILYDKAGEYFPKKSQRNCVYV